ncbi:YpiF family protein [Salisediminibacterium beveridgei]|uniref:DUF2487 family protein n=1 Tax=Salisediminibacterium beveridgei TaxID=632773 RepID=A0A1D7QUX7_9BACI|nr:YpiF family protein [Salisediminibacterium beveridgei]AOM82820.1 hypothetical protein BBEV_1457 [Salisediminibacterium beveridgei]
MKWNSQSIETFVSAKEFVDTALIPLIPLDLQLDPSKAALQGEYIAILADEVEKQLTGRVMLVPPYPYKQNKGKSDTLIHELNEWNSYYYNAGMVNTICLTCDEELVELNALSKARVIWMPMIPLDHLEARQAKEMVREQASQVLPKIMKIWQGKGTE